MQKIFINEGDVNSDAHSLLSEWVYRKNGRKGICLLRIFSNGYLLANL
jgi:hypothetical protein